MYIDVFTAKASNQTFSDFDIIKHDLPGRS